MNVDNLPTDQRIKEHKVDTLYWKIVKLFIQAIFPKHQLSFKVTFKFYSEVFK